MKRYFNYKCASENDTAEREFGKMLIEKNRKKFWNFAKHNIAKSRCREKSITEESGRINRRNDTFFKCVIALKISRYDRGDRNFRWRENFARKPKRENEILFNSFWWNPRRFRNDQPKHETFMMQSVCLLFSEWCVFRVNRDKVIYKIRKNHKVISIRKVPPVREIKQPYVAPLIPRKRVPKWTYKA